MKALILSDLHAGISEDNLEKLKLTEFDIIVTLGDISKFSMQTLIKVFNNKRFYCVYGNHDDFSFSELYGIIDEEEHLGTFAFIHGAHSYKEGIKKYKRPQFLMQKESVSIAKKLPSAHILFSHDSRFIRKNRRDETHCGLQGITFYLKKHKPKWHFYGHHHENKISKFKKTVCVCVFGAVVFDSENKTVEQIFN